MRTEASHPPYHFHGSGLAARRRFRALEQPEGIALAAAIGWLLGAIANLEFVVLAAAMLGGFLSLCWFWGFLGDREALVRMLPLGGVSLVAILNLGFLAAWAASTLGLEKDFAETFGVLGVSFAAYSLAVFYAMLFAAMLAFVGRAPLFRRMEDQLANRLLATGRFPTQAVVLFILGCMVVDVGAYASGILRFREIATEGSEEGRVAWFLPFLESVFAAQIFLNALLFARLFGRRTNWSLAALAAVSAGLTLLVYFSRGRSAFIMALALHFLYWCYFRGKRPNLKFLISFGIAAWLVVPQLLVVNNAMRHSSGAGQAGRGGDVLSTISQGYEDLQNSQVAQEEGERSLENFSRRPLVANPLARCLLLDPRMKEYMLGYNMFSSFVWVIPRVLFPDKVKFSAYEGLLYRHFPDRIFLRDTSDSAYLYAYVDFGWVGLLLYPMLLGLLWLACLWVMLFLKNPLFIAFVFVGWPPLFLLGVGEGTMVGWFVELRNSVMFVLIFWVVEIFIRQPSSPKLSQTR